MASHPPLDANLHVGPRAVEQARAAAAAVRERARDAIGEQGVDIGLILGSGLGPLAAAIEGSVAIPYRDLPGMPAASAPGHAGELVIGTLNGRRVAAMRGRLHAYEGYTAATCAYPVRILHALGAERLVVTNACGGLNPQWEAGDLMLQLDFINHTFEPRAHAAPSDGIAPRFPVMFDAYDRRFPTAPRRQAAARRLDLTLREGVYLAIAGPAYATRAELRAYRAWGADAIGMSTVHEVTLARSLAMRVLGVSVVTDMAIPDGHAHASGDDGAGDGETSRRRNASSVWCAPPSPRCERPRAGACSGSRPPARGSGRDRQRGDADRGDQGVRAPAAIRRTRCCDTGAA
jgi:purine-nucleoside phosphorylase